MRSSSSQDDWVVLNDKLARVGKVLIREMEGAKRTQPDYHILLGYLRKTTNTLRAVQLLIKESLFEQAQILARTLFELRVTFDCFIDMLRRDPRKACQRVIDAILAEKIKQLESVDYQSKLPEGFQINRKDFERIKAELNQRYTCDELRAIRKYGFTGLSIEARCRQTRHDEVYNIIYRNFSRNVHSSDYVEHIGADYLEDERFSDYLAARNVAMLHVAHVSAGGIIQEVNFILGGPMNDELDGIRKEEIGLRHSRRQIP